MLNRGYRFLIGGVVGISVGVGAGGTASATVVLYDSHSFESSAGYTSGGADLTGQPSIGGASNT